MIAALVPVKHLDVAKSRLRPGLGAQALAELTLAMLGDVLEALRDAAELQTVAVVTEDERVADAARAAGARAIVRRDTGLNASLDAAAHELAAEGAEALLVVLGDVPGIGPGDVRTLVAAASALGPKAAVLAPARDGGTAALLRRPPDAIPSRFGPGSAAAHRAEATRIGVDFREIPLPGLAVDLDRPEDLDEFARGPGAGRRTRAFLARSAHAATR